MNMKNCGCRNVNRKGKAVDTSNENFQRKLLNNWTISVVFPVMNPRIDGMIAPIVGPSQTLLTSATKEVVADAARSGACNNQTLRQVSRTGVNGITPGDTGMDLRSKPAPFQVLIGSTTILPACGISGGL